MNSELPDFEQGDDSIVANILDIDTGVRREVEAKFLAGCDGARSMVREAKTIIN